MYCTRESFWLFGNRTSETTFSFTWSSNQVRIRLMHLNNIQAVGGKTCHDYPISKNKRTVLSQQYGLVILMSAGHSNRGIWKFTTIYILSTCQDYSHHRQERSNCGQQIVLKNDGWLWHWSWTLTSQNGRTQMLWATRDQRCRQGSRRKTVSDSPMRSPFCLQEWRMKSWLKTSIDLQFLKVQWD